MQLTYQYLDLKGIHRPMMMGLTVLNVGTDLDVVPTALIENVTVMMVRVPAIDIADLVMAPHHRDGSSISRTD